MSKKSYIEVTLEEFKLFLDLWLKWCKNSRREQYLTKDWDIWIAADNRSWDFFVEEFDSRRKAVRRLNKF